MTTTPHPAPENPDRPYYGQMCTICDGKYFAVYLGNERIPGTLQNSLEQALKLAEKINDAHEAAAKAKPEASALLKRAEDAEAEVKRLKEEAKFLTATLVEVHGYLMREQKRMTLSESAAYGTQNISWIVSRALDGKRVPVESNGSTSTLWQYALAEPTAKPEEKL